jgi:hypothetical protein
MDGRLYHRTLAEDRFDAMTRETDALKATGLLTHVEAHLVGAWRHLGKDQQRELLKFWRKLAS